MTNHANKEGGWGEGNDDQQCPSCGRKICGARASTAKGGRQTNKCANAGVCHNPAGYRTDHGGVGKCVYHFGNTPSVAQAANRQAIRHVMRRYGVPVPIDPEDALREEIHRTVGHVRWLADKVAGVGDPEPDNEVPDLPRSAAKRPPALDGEGDASAGTAVQIITSQPTGDDALVWGVSERVTQEGSKESFDKVTMAAGTSQWLQVYMAERGHLAKITEIAMKAGLESRRLDWAEAMADRLIVAFEDYATRLGLDPKAPEVQAAAAHSLESIIAVAS